MLISITAPALKPDFRIYFNLIEPFNTGTPGTGPGQIRPNHGHASCPRFTPVTQVSPRAATLATSQGTVNKIKSLKNTIIAEYRGGGT